MPVKPVQTLSKQERKAKEKPRNPFPLLSKGSFGPEEEREESAIGGPGHRRRRKEK